MYCRENHQPGSLPCGHVTVWNVTYFMKILNHQALQCLFTAAIHYSTVYLRWISNYCLKQINALWQISIIWHDIITVK